ncbi:hypothetical protein HUJ04_011546 [Dendroctonus ponderosae]|nr:hypothetical protein HUJ04_011546 [Dendroctonus ponderosae]
MTVTYTSEVTTSTGLGCFLKLLRRWRGSIYKIVWADLILFLGLYYALNLSYLYAMNQYTKEHFVKVVNYCARNGNLIPLSFVLGFFVNIVYSRLPLAWAANITTRARHEGIIRDDCSVKCILEQINIFRSKCGEMLAYDWISIPLVYTQVVTIAVYTYFLITVIGNQFIEVDKKYVDRLIFSFPFMPVLEFFFYMGWLKVAETLINPFGEDDDDFDVVWMIDRHIQVCYLLVDKIHQDHPKLKKDYYWQQTAPDTLPFTVASQQYMKDTPVQSAEKLQVKKTDQDLIIREEVSHHRPRSLWGSLGNVLFSNRRRGDNKYCLRRIAVDDNAEIFDEMFGQALKTTGKQSVNTYEEEGPNKIKVPIFVKTNCNENVEEFECLRKQRLEHQRAKLLKYMELLKANKGQDGAQIVKAIIK